MRSLFLILSNPRYFGPAFVFASVNIWFGTWAIYIPTVKERLGIDKADLGIALFCLSLGVFTVFPLAPRLINAWGVGKATWRGILLSSLFALFPLVSPTYTSLCVALFLFGASNAFIDIAMNTLVTELEKSDGVQFMSSAHGFFSLGGVVAGLSSFLIAIIGGPFWHMLLTVVVVLLVNMMFKNQYLSISAVAAKREKMSIALFKPLLLLGLIGFVSFASEGAIVDWSALYLKEITAAPEALIGAGFLAFSVMMTLGRFLGDGISSRMGPVKIVALGAIIAICGYLSVLSEHTILAIVGFALTGLGFSVIVPELFRIGGKVSGVPSSQGVAFIAGTGYAGFLLGPVVLGFLAEAFTLRTSFWVLMACAALVVFATFGIKQQKP
ncbi:MAG: MFS transporter [Bacteroidota bacterium]